MKTHNLFDIKDKVILITGGSGFLGSHYVSFLKKCGAIVLNLDFKGDYAIDVTNEKQVKKTMQDIINNFKRIDVVVNNASYGTPHIDYENIQTQRRSNSMAPFEEYSLDLFLKGISVDLTGTFLMCKYALPQMKLQKKGSIVNIGSIYGVVPPDQRLYAGMKNPANPIKDIVKPAYYSVAKAGLWGLTMYLASYAAPHIRVNQLSFGGIRNKEGDVFIARYSDKTMLGRMGEVEDTYGALVFLASDASRYVTGINLMVDGGITAW